MSNATMQFAIGSYGAWYIAVQVGGFWASWPGVWQAARVERMAMPRRKHRLRRCPGRGRCAGRAVAHAWPLLLVLHHGRRDRDRRQRPREDGASPAALRRPGRARGLAKGGGVARVEDRSGLAADRRYRKGWVQLLFVGSDALEFDPSQLKRKMPRGDDLAWQSISVRQAVGGLTCVKALPGSREEGANNRRRLSRAPDFRRSP
jgi:hypothetical protein